MRPARDVHARQLRRHDAGRLAAVPGGTGGTGGIPVEPVAQEILDRMEPWTAAPAGLNFLGTADAAAERIRAVFAPADLRRPATIKRNYDPDNLFRFNHNIPLARMTGGPFR